MAHRSCPANGAACPRNGGCLEPWSDNVKCSRCVNHLRRRKIFKTDAKLPFDIAYVKWIDANGAQLLTSALRHLREDGDPVPIPGAILDMLLPSRAEWSAGVERQHGGGLCSEDARL